MATVLLQSILSAVACAAFSIVFNAPRKELPWCGLNGGLGWLVYALLMAWGKRAVIATLVASAAVTIAARLLSYHRQAPSTLYHIPGILPLVPGMAVYNAMHAAIQGLILETYSNALLALKLAGAIGVGSILILILPYSLFALIPRAEKKSAPKKGARKNM